MIKKSNAIAIFAVLVAVIIVQTTIFTVILYTMPKPQKPHIILPEEMPIGKAGDLMVILYNSEDTVKIGFWHGDVIDKDGNIQSYR